MRRVVEQQFAAVRQTFRDRVDNLHRDRRILPTANYQRWHVERTQTIEQIESSYRLDRCDVTLARCLADQARDALDVQRRFLPELRREPAFDRRRDLRLHTVC